MATTEELKSSDDPEVEQSYVDRVKSIKQRINDEYQKKVESRSELNGLDVILNICVNSLY